ncbi:MULTISPECIES: hypothetical protein [unclassified Amycolatopsis]|uniref:hypothetical protein n=1 Tax=unclassified Amycolatopsis TaxID=2618356 RepID=UPI0021036CB9|nr:hypothetical protein [Amycolatopsis sp. DSM 110486]
MSVTRNLPVVVHVDGAETAIAAVVWTVGEAARRHAPLLVFTAYGFEGRSFGSKVCPPSGWLLVKEAEARQLSRRAQETLQARCSACSAALPASIWPPRHDWPVVVRGHETIGGPVVVGVGGSPLNEAAIGWTFDEPSLRDADLVALHAWHDGDLSRFSVGSVMFEGESLYETGHRLFAQRLAGEIPLRPR